MRKALGIAPVLLTEVAPKERFDKVMFSNEILDGEALSMVANYRCPECDEVIQFTKLNFEERAALCFSNLSKSVASEMDRWAAGKGIGDAAFLDWVCPGCKTSVRVYAQLWAGGRHGDHGVELLAVVECPAGRTDAPNSPLQRTRAAGPRR
jgi:hypothetical protein